MTRTPCSPRSGARWAPTPRRSTATAGASTSARSACAWSTSAARRSAPASPRRAQYIFRVVDALRELTGIGFARAENLIEATQNADVFVEVSGILKAHAATLLKICGDLRLLSSGPEAGLGEIRLPRRQAGSSIMPGKVNPVIPEAVSQVALLVIGYDATIATAAGLGSLELNAFLPLVADCLLESLASARPRRRDAAPLLRRGHRGRRGALRRARARLQRGGHGARAGDRLRRGLRRRRDAPTSGARPSATSSSPTAVLTAEQYDELLTAEAVCRLGTPQRRGRGVED